MSIARRLTQLEQRQPASALPVPLTAAERAHRLAAFFARLPEDEAQWTANEQRVIAVLTTATARQETAPPRSTR